MAYQGPRLRGGWTSSEPYPLGQIPDSIILSIASSIVYWIATGKGDITGDDWGEIFAAALGATHLKKPLGIVDISLGKTAWSAKTVGLKNPLRARKVSLISGRNNLRYSFGNENPLADIENSGQQVISIWNNRVQEATQQFTQLRTVTLIRDIANLRFKVFETVTSQLDPSEYTWTRSKGGNLHGLSRDDGRHVLTWQSDGSQFTIIRPVSASSRSFQIKMPEVINPEVVFAEIGYRDDWVTFL